MRLKFVKSVSLLLLICVFALCACGPSSEFLSKKQQGLYPTTADFPNTKWVCKELDMSFCMFGYEEDYIIGSYVIDDVSYRVVASFEWDEFNFEFYSFTDFSPSMHSDNMVNCDRILCGFIHTKYSYDKDENTIVCSIQNYDAVAEESIPKVLTFENVGLIAQNSNMCWHAQEIDMYLYSFSNVDGYFRGEIVIGGEKCHVHALEIGNNNYFVLSIENGKVNNLRSGTTSELIRMCFEITDDEIIAKVSDEYLSSTEAFPYWSYDGVVTFNRLFESKENNTGDGSVS